MNEVTIDALGLETLVGHPDLDPSITGLKVVNGEGLETLDGFAVLTQLTYLDLSYCSALQNVDGLAKLTQLTSLDLKYCTSLQNVAGLANLWQLTSLDLCQILDHDSNIFDFRMPIWDHERGRVYEMIETACSELGWKVGALKRPLRAREILQDSWVGDRRGTGLDIVEKSEFEKLIKGVVPLTRSFGSVSPVRGLLEVYAARFPESGRILTVWIVRNRVNVYDPFLDSYGHACSIEEFGVDRFFRNVRDKYEYLKVSNVIRSGNWNAVDALFASYPDVRSVACAEFAHIGLDTSAELHGNEVVEDFLRYYCGR